MTLDRDRISVERIQQASNFIDPVFLNTPQYNCESLSDALGLELTLKIETANPVRSFKGRGSEYLISQAPAAQPMICASAGNFGQAMAYSCRKKKIPLTVIASVNANPYKVERMKSLGATVQLFGQDFDAAKAEAKRLANENNLRMVEDSQDIETVEGAGTMAMELLKLPYVLDALIVPLGNGAMFNGLASVFKKLSPSTKMIVAQAAGAPAMINSWKAKQPISNDAIHTIADGIAVRVPVPQALEDMQTLVDQAYLIQEDTILKAMKMLHLHTGLVPEPSAAVGIATFLENKQAFENKKVATIFCGGNLTEKQTQEFL